MIDVLCLIVGSLLFTIASSTGGDTLAGIILFILGGFLYVYSRVGAYWNHG